MAIEYVKEYLREDLACEQGVQVNDYMKVLYCDIMEKVKDKQIIVHEYEFLQETNYPTLKLTINDLDTQHNPKTSKLYHYTNNEHKFNVYINSLKELIDFYNDTKNSIENDFWNTEEHLAIRKYQYKHEQFSKEADEDYYVFFGETVEDLAIKFLNWFDEDRIESSMYRFIDYNNYCKAIIEDYGLEQFGNYWVNEI